MRFPRVCITPALGPPRHKLCPEMSFAVGRSPACWVRISDRAVSAVHAHVEVGPTTVLVSDSGSLGGIVADGQKVQIAELGLGRGFSLAGWRLSIGVVDVADAPVNEMLEMLAGLEKAGRGTEILAICQTWAAASPDLAAAQRCLAKASLDAGNARAALEAAGRALALKPGDARSMALEALAMEALGDLDLAAEAWAEARRAGVDTDQADEALRRLKAKLDVFSKISGIMGKGDPDGMADEPATFRAGAFSFYFMAPSQAGLVLKTHAMLTKASDSVDRYLGYRPGEVPVRIIGEPWPGPDGAAAMYDGGILIRASAFDGGDPAFLPVVLAHEYVHLAIDGLALGKCPPWLNEGLAQYITQNLRPADVRILQKALAAEALLPLEVLNSDWGLLQDKALIDLAYAQSFSVAQYMVEKHGWEAVRDLLRQAAQGGDTFKADIERDWLQWLA